MGDKGELTEEQFLEQIQPLPNWSPQLSFHDDEMLKCIKCKEVLTVEKLTRTR